MATNGNETPRVLIRKMYSYQAAIHEGRSIRPWEWCEYTFEPERLKEEVKLMREALRQERLLKIDKGKP